MGLFKDIYCSNCGEKTKMLFRTQLCDGGYLCSKCTTCVPSYMLSSFNDKYSIEDYHAFKEYVDYSNQKLRPLFHETHNFYTIHIDTENRIFYIGYGVDANTLFLNFASVTRFDLVFKAENYKEGVLGDKVTGKILFELGMAAPYFYHEEVLSNNAKAKAKKKLFGSKIEFDNPSGMDDFIFYFNRAWEADIQEANTESGDYTDVSLELQQAMNLFMLDSMDDTTHEDLKLLRNRLIKTFHPDAGETDNAKHAQKINAAYEILIKAME